MTVRFSPAILQSDFFIKKYLESKETIKEIKAEAKKPYIKGQGQLGTLQVTWQAISSPLWIEYALFIQVIGYLSIYLLSAEQTGQKLIARSHYILDDSMRWVYSLAHGSNLLISVLNTQSPEKAEEIYTHAPIPLTKIPKTIQTRIANSYINNHHLSFDNHGGQCFGLSDSFAHFYFQTKSAFSDEEQHLISITTKLQYGAGKEAALLQYLQMDTSKGAPNPPLLALEKKRLLVDNKPTVQKVTDVFQRLKPGLYGIGTECHRFNFYKGKKCDYVFEPNAGLIALPTAKDLKEWCNGDLVTNKRFIVHRLSRSA